MSPSLLKVHPNRRATLSASSAILELVAEVGDALGVTPIKGAAQILLSILKVIEVRLCCYCA